LKRYALQRLAPLLMLMALLSPNAAAEVYTGSLGGADNLWEQWIPITIPSDGTFTTQMTVSGDLTGGNSGHCLYDSSKTNSYPYACAYTSPLGPWGLKAGNYYLKVWTNNSSGRGTYMVTTSFTAQPLANDAEPNDAYAQSGTLSSSGSVTGSLGYWDIAGSQDYRIDFEDWWRVTLPTEGKLNINYIFDQALAGATGVNLYAQDGNTEILDMSSTLAAGTYYVRTWLNNGNNFGGYTLSLAFSGTVAPCTWTLTPDTLAQSHGAGTGSIELTASAAECSWSAHSDQPWLNLITASGEGSSTLNYSISTNTETAPRSATITVNDQIITVTQAGAALLQPAGTIMATGPITAQTLTLHNIGIASAELARGITLYIAAYFNGTYYFFSTAGWTTEMLPYQSAITTLPNAITLANGDLSGLVGTQVLLGYGSGTNPLDDMLQQHKYAQIYTITGTDNVGSTDLQNLSLWDIYGSGRLQANALEFGDQIGGDFGDEDHDGNPVNVWSTGLVSDSAGFGYDIDWAVAKQTFSAPFTVAWNGCLSYSGPDTRFVLGRKNTAFTNKANSSDPIVQDIYVQAEWETNSASLVVGTLAGASVRSPAIDTTLVTPNASVDGRTPYAYQAVCGDFKLEWGNQTATFYFDDSKIGDLPYASGYGEAFGIAFRSFANPVLVNSLLVTQP